MGDRTWQRRLLFLLTGLAVLLLIGQNVLSIGRWLNEPFPGFFVHENLTVGPYSVPGWTGQTAGLQPLDRVLSINGHDLRSRADLYQRARSVPAASSLRYRVLRNSETLDLTIATMNFSLRDWLLSFGIYIFIGLAFLLIGVSPYFFHASSPAALPLCFMVLTVFVWFQTTFDFMTEGVLPKELRIFALLLTPSAAIHLALLLRQGNLTSLSLRPIPLILIYGISMVLGILNSVTFFSPLGYWIVFFRAAYVYACVGALTFLIITGYALRRTDSDLERSRLRVMFVGALLGFLIPTLITVMTSSFQWPIPYNIALVPTIFFPISVAYALLKYSLFDLGRVLKIALSRVALMALLVVIYAIIAFVVAPWAGSYAKDPLVPIFFSVLVVAVFNPLLRWLESVVDRYLYRQDYDPIRVQEEISMFLRTLDAAPSLARGFIQRITELVGIKNADLMYRGKNATELLRSSTETMDQPDPGMGEPMGFAEIWSAGDYRGISRDEVITNPRFREKRDLLLEVFARWRAELLMPLVYEREVRGLVSFGAKMSGHEYSAEDFRLLGTLTEQLALSLENGRLYEESIAARTRAEDSNKRLIEMDRIKKDFVANVCHELRTPVSTIIGYSEVLRDLDLSGDARKFLDRLVHNGQELSSLMDNLMDFSRMETHGSSAQTEIVKLKEILTGLETMTQRLIRERPIEFGIHMESAIDCIESDGQKLQQILVQLLTNALKFTEKGRIDLSICKRHTGVGEFLEIAVADTGIGIKREDQEIIFDDFRQLDGSSTRHYGGTGLGLGLCKKLAAALGGEIRVTSEVGVGSVFSLLLPVKSPAFGLEKYSSDQENSLSL
ncbi:MAG TPA: ATP-binding protein [Candidatus Binatia bacterium]|jgi:signal transduction histidine kinase